jgi:thymidylate kinase
VRCWSLRLAHRGRDSRSPEVGRASLVRWLRQRRSIMPGTCSRHSRAGGTNSVIIEIVGPAGAGKSTLAANLERLLQQQGVEVVLHRAIGFVDPGGNAESKVSRRVNQARSVLSNPRLALWCWRHGGQALEPRALVAMCVRARFSARLRRRPGIHLLDEGPLRIAPVLSARAQARGPELFALLPLPDFVVALTVDPGVAIERVRARPVGRITEASVLERLRTVNRHHVSAFRAIQRLVPAVQLDTTDGSDHTAAVCEWILTQLQHRGHDAGASQA